jgi:hypothetical protein
VAANDAPGVFPVGTNFVTWTAADASGNSTSKIQIVVITNAQLPRITAPPAVTVTADAGQNYASSVSLGQAVVSDSCGIAGVTNDAPAHFPIGTNFVTWTVINIHGNRNTAAQQVIVNPAPDLPHQATGIVSNGDGTFTITFQGSSNSVYTVQISSNLLDWIPVQTNTSAGDGTWSYTDADAPNAPVRFYRSARP